MQTAIDDSDWGFGATNYTPPLNAIQDSSDNELLKKWGFETSLPSLASPKTTTITEELFEGWKTSTRQGKVTTSLSEFTDLLAKLGIPGPRHLRGANLRDTAVQIGQGSQFVVFRENEPSQVLSQPNIVMKRVRISKAALNNENDLSKNSRYLMTLRNLELEVLCLGILKHRNIVSLVGWGYDYDDRYTPVPFLSVEAALMSLTNFLDTKCDILPKLSHRAWDVRHQLALDIAAGLEAMHNQNIAHGDVKPDNVLIFQQDDPGIPYTAKLSDFGVCVDMRASSSTLTPEVYLGTEVWVGSEVGEGKWREGIHGEFEPMLLRNFDSYSYGLLLLAIFVTDGKPPLMQERKSAYPTPYEAVETLLEANEECPDPLKKALRVALRNLLSIKPCDRQLPSPKLLHIDSLAYNNWLRVSATSIQHAQDGRRGSHAYWVNMDTDLLYQLDQQYTDYQNTEKNSTFSGGTLFGMAQCFARRPIDGWHGKVLKYMTAAVNKGNHPAQAIYAQVCEALNQPPDVDEMVLDKWTKQAVTEGYLFATHPFLVPGKYHAEKEVFRRNGGYCTDTFLHDQNILTIARDVRLLQKWISEYGVSGIVDSAGNSIMHVCAAIGEVKSMEVLVVQANTTNLENDKGETPLYKACQAGHARIVELLLHNGSELGPSKSTEVTLLHWLFAFPDEDIAGIAKLLVHKGAVAVNSKIKPKRYLGRPLSSLSTHFPFEWPLGTPFHWAAFARSKAAMRALLELGADINSTYDEEDTYTAPIAQAVYQGDAPMVEYLLRKGANALTKDSKGRNLLHMMSFKAGNLVSLAGKFDSWVRHGSWEKRVKASQDVISLLVKAGVDIEGRAETYGNLTPLLQACASPFQSDHVVVSLLSAGADADAINTGARETVLQSWCSLQPTTIEYPLMRSNVLRAVIARTRDLDRRGGWVEQTALHTLASSSSSIDDLVETVQLLVRDSEHRADINARDRDGYTPLMQTCVFQQSNLEALAQCFLALGALPGITTPFNENVITRIAENERLMDVDSKRALEMILTHPSFTKDSLESFIDATSIEALARVCYQGKPLAAEYLLALGMYKRINAINKIKFNEGTVLDHAISGANSARITYLRVASTFPTDAEREEVDRSGKLYIANNFGINTVGQPSQDRGKEAYWAYPKVFEILKRYGAKRGPLIEGESGREPSFTDAVRLPSLGFTPETQPNRGHWKPLYDLEMLQEDWEEQAFEIVKMMYEDEDLSPPQVMVFDRWPRIVEVLTPKEGWYKAILKDSTKVDVKIEEGKVTVIRDTKGRLLQNDER